MKEIDNDRGQVGIGTLIVFIAMVLVAAIAAGVLVNTAGVLQAQSETTGEQSVEQVSDRLIVGSAIGNVNHSGSTSVVEYVNLTVYRGAGAGDINLSEATIQWIGPDEGEVLTYAPKSNGDTGTYILNSSRFGVEQITAEGDNSRVLVTDRDRMKIVLWAGNTTGGFTGGLRAGEEVKLTITTASGAQTTYHIQIPKFVADRSTIKL